MFLFHFLIRYLTKYRWPQPIDYVQCKKVDFWLIEPNTVCCFLIEKHSNTLAVAHSIQNILHRVQRDNSSVRVECAPHRKWFRICIFKHSLVLEFLVFFHTNSRFGASFFGHRCHFMSSNVVEICGAHSAP